MKSRNTSIFTAATILFIISNSAFAYRDVIDLGTLGGGYYSYAYSLNDSGQIVGMADSSSGSYACIFDSTGRGNNKNLKSLGGSYSEAYSINKSGQTVGMATLSGGGYYHACLFDSTGQGNNKNLGGLGGNGSMANAINNSGTIVGWAQNSSNQMRACLFDPTGGGANKGLGDGGAASINSAGWIVGTSYDHACIFDSTGNGANKDLGSISGYSYSWASSINNSNCIIGSVYNKGYNDFGVEIEFQQACIFDSTGGGANISLGTLSGYSYCSAEFINDNSQIVGVAYNTSGQTAACLFDPTGNGSNINLNTLINPKSGWILLDACSINNDGLIVGYGVHGTSIHAFLLTPEPATLLLFALGGLALRRKH